MDAKVKNSIKTTIKQVINSNEFSGIVLKVGHLGTKLIFNSKKEFGERVLSQLENDSVSDIIFEGSKNGVLFFKTSYLPKSNFCNDRGYGQGRNMAD